MRPYRRRVCQAAAALTATLLATATPDALACSVFTVADASGVYFGNNEDYVKPGYLWTVPARKGRLARICFGFEDRFMQGGMNERGLCFDASALPEVTWEKPKGKPSDRKLIERIMETCATVDEALAQFEAHHSPHLAKSQFMFADAGGAAAVVTGLPDGRLSVVRRSESALIMTNTRLEAAAYRCPRYVRAEQVLDAGTPGLARVRDALAAIRQTGPACTVYSTIYEPAARRFHVYEYGDFSTVRSFDFDVLLAEGPHDTALAALFDSAPGAFEARCGGDAQTYDTRVALSAEELAAYAGRYRGDQSGQVGTFAVEDGDLVFTSSQGHQLRVWPEGRDRFRMPDGGQVIFHRVNGAIAGLSVFGGGGYQSATRVP